MSETGTHSPLDVLVIHAGNAAGAAGRSLHLTVLVGALSVGAGWLAWRQREEVRKRFGY